MTAALPLSAAERMRRTRARRARGLWIYRVEADEVGIEALLVREGFLAGWDDDPRSIEAALSAYLAFLVARNNAAESGLLDEAV